MLVNFINIYNKKNRLININTNLYNDITFTNNEVSIDYGNKVQVLKYSDNVIKEIVYDTEHKTNTDVFIENMMLLKFKSFTEYKIEKFNEGKSWNNINEELGILGN